MTPKEIPCTAESCTIDIEPSNLLVNHNLLASHDPFRARNSVEQVFCKHLLRLCTSSTPLNFIHRSASLGKLSFNFIAYGADVEVQVKELNRSHYIFVMPLSGKAAVTTHGQDTELSRGSVIALDPSSPFKFEMLSDHSHLAIGIPKQNLNTYISTHYSLNKDKLIQFHHKPYLLKDIGSSLFDFISYVCHEIDKPGTITSNNVIASSIEKAFLAFLTSALLEEDPNEEPQHSITTGPAHVKKAEIFMEANLTEPILANDIIEAAGVPSRTLYYAYKKYHGISPIVWLKLRRLRQARLDLLDPQKTDINITDISNRYQQPHVGRFSKAYFNEFGEYPSETRKAIKHSN